MAPPSPDHQHVRGTGVPESRALLGLANRLPRGRTYVRNARSWICVAKGKSTPTSRAASCTPSDRIAPMAKARWRKVVGRARADRIPVGILRGELAADCWPSPRQERLLPEPKAISLECSCPEGGVCSVAAVLYGVAPARRQAQRSILRQVDQTELLASPTSVALSRSRAAGQALGADTLPMCSHRHRRHRLPRGVRTGRGLGRRTHAPEVDARLPTATAATVDHRLHDSWSAVCVRGALTAGVPFPARFMNASGFRASRRPCHRI